VEVFDLVWEGEGLAVFGDDNGVGGEKFGGAEVAEHAEIVIGGGVGRVEEDVAERWLSGVARGHGLQAAKGVGGKNRCAGADGEGFEIFADEGGGGRVVFDEDDFRGATAEGFDADGAGAGEEVDEMRAGDFLSEDVEEGFAKLVAGGTEG